MKLLYMYIFDLNDGMIVNQEINFDLNYNTTFKDGYLEVSKANNPLTNYYGRNISNITAIVGKNGSGKTSLLDAIGMTYYDRNSVLKTDSYFILYKHKENYYIEFQNHKTYERIENLSLDINHYKNCLGFEVEFDGQNFIAKNYFFRSYDSKPIKNYAKYYYYQNGYKSSRISRNMSSISEDNRNYLFERHYIRGVSEFEKYSLITEEIEVDSDAIQQISGSNLAIHFEYNDIDVHDSKFTNVSEFEMYLERFKHELSFIDIHIPLVDGDNEPEYSMEKYIEHYLSCIILSSLDYYLDIATKGEKSADETETIETFKSATISDYSISPAIIIASIEGLVSKSKEIKQEKKSVEFLMELLKFIYDRFEEEIELGQENFYYQAIIEFITELRNTSNASMTKNKILYKLDKFKENNVFQLLSVYDKYNEYSMTHMKNGLSNYFTIKYEYLSEGTENAYNLLSAYMRAASDYRVGEKRIFIIDEPDKTLHPELSRKFINDINRIINKTEREDIHLIITTHSPFVISDLLPESVYYVKDGSIFKNSETLAENIHSLLYNKFFLDYTIGEFVRQKIEQIYSDLKEANKVSRDERKYIEALILRIGDPVIKMALQDEMKRIICSTEDILEMEVMELRQLLELKEKKLMEYKNDKDNL